MLGFWLFCSLFGALIGLSAAQRRGFGKAGGVIGGILLGPFSPLMYLVSSSRRRCPECAEWIEQAARVCPHCQARFDTKGQPVDSPKAAARSSQLPPHPPLVRSAPERPARRSNSA